MINVFSAVVLLMVASSNPIAECAYKYPLSPMGSIKAGKEYEHKKNEIRNIILKLIIPTCLKSRLSN